jgi:predicted tellurium resistance membrane protein TerC
MTSPEAWISLATLTVLEIVLGIDNIVFISILADRLPKNQQGPARQIGLILAMVTRILLLLSISFIMRLTEPFVTVLDHPLSGRDLILIAGGLFLLTKSTREIHHRLSMPRVSIWDGWDCTNSPVRPRSASTCVATGLRRPLRCACSAKICASVHVVPRSMSS